MSLDEFVDELALVRAANPREPDAPPEDSANAVKVMTVHSAKGLEFPVVFVAACTKASTPSPPVVAFSRRYGLGARWRNPATRARIRTTCSSTPCAQELEAARDRRERPPALRRHDPRRTAPGAQFLRHRPKACQLGQARRRASGARHGDTRATSWSTTKLPTATRGKRASASWQERTRIPRASSRSRSSKPRQYSELLPAGGGRAARHQRHRHRALPVRQLPAKILPLRHTWASLSPPRKPEDAALIVRRARRPVRRASSAPRCTPCWPASRCPIRTPEALRLAGSLPPEPAGTPRRARSPDRRVNSIF